MEYILLIVIYYSFIGSQPASGMIKTRKLSAGTAYHNIYAIVDLILGIGVSLVLSFFRTEAGEILYIPEYFFWMAIAGSILLIIFGCIHAVKAMCSPIP